MQQASAAYAATVSKLTRGERLGRSPQGKEMTMAKFSQSPVCFGGRESPLLVSASVGLSLALPCSHYQQHQWQRELWLPAQHSQWWLRGQQHQLYFWSVQRPRRGEQESEHCQRLQGYPSQGLQPEHPLQERWPVEKASCGLSPSGALLPNLLSPLLLPCSTPRPLDLSSANVLLPPAF